MFLEGIYRPDFPITPRSSLSKNKLSQNDSLSYFVEDCAFWHRELLQEVCEWKWRLSYWELLGNWSHWNLEEVLIFFEGSSSCASSANVWGFFFLRSQLDYHFHTMIIYFSLKLIVILRLPLIIVTCSKCHPHTRRMCTLQRWIITSRWELLS